MRWSKCFMVGIVMGATATAWAQQAPVYNAGRAPTAEELRALDLFVGPSGKGLPPGQGTAKEGASVYATKCLVCHGPNAEGNKAAATKYNGNIRGIGKQQMSRYPFATTLWSYINSAMPRRINDIGVMATPLTPDEVYAVTAFVLFRSGIIQETDVLDARSLPKIRMPGRAEHLEPFQPK